MKEDIKIIQIGVGSMGKRRVRNLKHIGFNTIDCFDIKSDRVAFAAEKYGIRPIYELESINWKKYTHLIISTPPDIHMKYAKIGVLNNLHTFIEASVTNGDIDDVIALHSNNSKERESLLSPSCTMRFDPIVVKAKEIIDSNELGNVLTANHYFGQYLPYWHPYEDIKDFYVSNKETGAAREIVPFDLVYLTWLFGDLTDFRGYTNNSGCLGIDIDDIYCFNAVTSKRVLLQMTIEVLSKVPIRETKIILQDGYMLLDNVKGTLSIFDGKSQSWKYINRSDFADTFSSEEMYVKEMTCFMNASLGKGIFPYTLEEDKKILDTLVDIENKSIRLSLPNN